MMATLFAGQTFAKPGDELSPGTETITIQQQIYWNEDTTVPDLIADKKNPLEIELSNSDPITGMKVSMAILGFGSSDFALYDAEKLVIAKLTVHCDPSPAPVAISLYKAGLNFRIGNTTWNTRPALQSSYIEQKIVQKDDMDISFDMMYDRLKEGKQSYQNYTFAIACNNPGTSLTLYSMNELSYPGMRPTLELTYVK